MQKLYGAIGKNFKTLDGLSAGAGITSGTGTVYRSGVTRDNGLAKTSILIDLTGLDLAAAGDIIGVSGTTSACHIGRIDDDYAGTVIGGRMTCLEVPAGGDPDIDLYAADEGTGVEDGAITGLTETALVDAGDATLGSEVILTAFPSAAQYLYLVGGAGATVFSTYTAGKLLIELWGTY